MEASKVTKINDFTNRPEEIESHDKICLSEYFWGNVSLVFTIDTYSGLYPFSDSSDTRSLTMGF